jgi:serine phosphatase RsbU (regulator of sigma subunit)
VPGPTLLAISLATSFLLGVLEGVTVAAIGVLLAVWVLDVNVYITPVVWIGMSIVSGLVGERLRRVEHERAELEAELQAGLVPVTRSFARGRVTIADRYVPAETRLPLAGDFYGVIDLALDRVAVLVGDVSGHGPRAAAISSHMRSTWRALAVAAADSQTMLRVLNLTMQAERERAGVEIFATVCCGTIDTAGRQAEFVLAGHPPPLLVCNGTAEELPLLPGPPLGIQEGDLWKPQTVSLEGDDWSLFLYTDGIVEGRAGPSAAERFGIDRLRALLARHRPLSTEDLDALLQEVERANGRPLGDDVVLLSLSSGPP